jgi:hypothetical protein
MGGRIVGVPSERPSINLLQHAGSPDTSASTVYAAHAGQSMFFAVVPSEGWEVDSMTLDGKPFVPKSNPKLMISQYRWPVIPVRDISADHTVRAVFRQEHFIITASAGAHGSISPAGNILVSHAGIQEFSFLPDAGYNVENVVVDGRSVPALTSFTFTNVTCAHTIEVQFGN